jgi:hypothetical protein
MRRKKNEEEEVLGLRTIAQVRIRLSCSTSKVYSLMRDGRLEMVKLDRGTRITERSLRRLEQSLLNPMRTEPVA